MKSLFHFLLTIILCFNVTTFNFSTPCEDQCIEVTTEQEQNNEEHSCDNSKCPIDCSDCNANNVQPFSSYLLISSYKYFLINPIQLTTSASSFTSALKTQDWNFKIYRPPIT
jgi:hypothetical protein